jgi:predicted dinucleotide-binding enzyme
MKVTLLGSGNMARAIATRMLAGGNSVTLLDRDPGKAQALAQELGTQAKQGVKVQAAGLGSPLAGSVVVSALYYAGGQRVFDAGALRRARQLEGLGLLNITLQSSMAKPWMSGVKIVD